MTKAEMAARLEELTGKEIEPDHFDTEELALLLTQAQIAAENAALEALAATLAEDENAG